MTILSKKGQTALETSFVVLLVVVAIAHVVTRANVLNYEATTMAKARAMAQGAAFELSMNGITTQLVRIDENVTASGLQVDLYVVSGDCSEARAKFVDRVNTSIAGWHCNSTLYSNSQLT